MSLYTPPYARVTVLSQSTNFAGSETNVFASASYTTYSYDGISSSVTFNTTQGAFTASEGGYYHAIINSYNIGGGDGTFRYRIYKNNSTVLYGGETRYDGQDHPSGSEKTFQTVLSLSAGDGIHVTRLRTSGASSNSVTPGTTFVLRKISGSFATAGRLISMASAKAGSFNPYMSGTLNTDYSTSSYGSDLTLSTTTKGVTLNSTGSYYYISNLGVEVAGVQTATINLNVPSLGFDLLNQSFRADTANDPVELTQHGMVYLADPMNVGLEAVPSASTTTSFIGSFGSTFTFIKLDNSTVYSTRFGSDSNTLSGSTVYNLLSTSSYTTNGYSNNNTPDIEYTDIQFNTGSGLITLLSGGIYHITFNGVLDNTSVSTQSAVQFTIRKNSTNCTDGTALYTSTISSDPDTDPIETTLTTLFSASANDTICICAKQTDPSPPNSVVLKENTYWSIYRVDTFTADPPPPDPYPYNETAGSASYSATYVINSFSKSNQYDRAVVQVPFGIQIPGPLSLRMRTDPAIKK